EGYQTAYQSSYQSKADLIITLSADSNKQLKSQVGALSSYIKRSINNHSFLNQFTIAELSNTLINHRIEKKCRIAFMAISLEEATSTLDYILKNFNSKKLSKNKIYFFDQEIDVFSNENDAGNQEIIQ